jgi:hypothetical protein
MMSKRTHRQVETEEGEALAKKWKCAFVESSAKGDLQVTKIFESMVTEVERTMNPPPEKGEGCVVS